MTANEAPEKIFMPNELLSEEWTRHIEGQDIEYTRTDAFIKKACEYLFENYHGEKLSLRMINDFKNYMKGE